MPSSTVVRERLIRRLVLADRPLSHRALIQSFSRPRRALAKEEFKKMLNENIFAIIGRGVKGDPIRVVFSAGYDGTRCKLCGQLVQHS